MACRTCSHRCILPAAGSYCTCVPVRFQQALLTPVEEWINAIIKALAPRMLCQYGLALTLDPKAPSPEAPRPGLVLDLPPGVPECPEYEVEPLVRPRVSGYQPVLTEDRDYCPGNGTRYHLLLVSLPSEGDRIRWVFTWVNAPRCGRSCILYSDAGLAMGYLEEKLDHTSEPDLRALMVWLERRGFDVLY